MRINDESISSPFGGGEAQIVWRARAAWMCSSRPVIYFDVYNASFVMISQCCYIIAVIFFS